MPGSMIKTKINIPALKRDLVLRKRISAALSDGLRAGRKLTIISAPAGFGKTTLVCEWLEAGKLPAAWISLDENDGDPARFLTYLVSALQTLIAGIGDEILGALQSAQTVSTQELTTILLNELDSVEDDFCLVLDDYHAIDSKAVDKLLAFFIDHMPRQMHLVLTTREDPALPLARLRAKNQLTEIRAAELRFTHSEAADFLNQVMGLNLSASEIAALETRTEGWIAGLQLAALSMQGKQDTTAFIRSFSGTHQFVLDYLLEEVLQKQSDPLQEFLLHTSILNRLSGPLCDALWPGQPTAAQETLEYLERANLFVVALDDERRWYRYHHLFGDLLRQRLSQKRSKMEITQLHLRASAWFEQAGEIGEAFHHAMSAVDYDRAARLAETSWQTMDDSFQTAAWLGWVNQLPAKVRQVRPVLCAQIGWAYMDAGNAEASESSLKEAEACLNHPIGKLVIVEMGQFRTLPARIAMARAYNAQVQSRFSDTLKYAEMLQDMVPPEDEFMQAQAAAILSGTHWANGELDQAYKFMSDWVAAAHQAGNFVFAVAASFGKADVLITQGRLRDATQVYQSAIDLAAAQDAQNFTAHHHLGLGLLYHETGEDELASQHLQKGFELGRHNTIVDWAYRKNLAQAHLQESEGNLENALDFLDEAQRFYVRTPIPNLRPVSALKARIYLKQGQLSKAQEWARQSGLLLQNTPDYLHEFQRLTLARIALAEQPDEAHFQAILSALNGHLQFAKKQNRRYSQIEILKTLALAFQTRGETPKAIAALEQALRLAEPEGYLRNFTAEGEPMRSLILGVKTTLQAATQAEAPSLTGYLEKILAKFPAPAQAHPAKTNLPNLKADLIDPLSERELEVLRLVALGLANQEISEKLFVALSTVKGHNLRIFGKLQARSRTEAVARARELGLL